MDFESYQSRLSNIRGVLEKWQSIVELEQELLKEKEGIEDRLKIYNDQGQYEADRRSFEKTKREWKSRRDNLLNDRQITQELKALCEPFITACNAGRVTLDEDLEYFYNRGIFRLTDPYSSEDLLRNERLDGIEIALQLIKSLYEASHKFRHVFDFPASDKGAGE